ncbi:hypothetical protein, partial [Streptomyces sp. T12]|uniref:hypothetical protein n=1 Tax=Streptomyces sp. T12 TaxID=477697 RepID=UPI0021BD7F82
MESLQRQFGQLPGEEERRMRCLVLDGSQRRGVKFSDGVVVGVLAVAARQAQGVLAVVIGGADSAERALLHGAVHSRTLSVRPPLTGERVS